MSDNLSGDEKIIDDILESYNGHTKALPRYCLWIKPEQYQVSKNRCLADETTARWYWRQKISRYKFYHSKFVKTLSDLIAKLLTTAIISV